MIRPGDVLRQRAACTNTSLLTVYADDVSSHYRCNACGRRFTARSTSAFSHHGFPDDLIALAVRHSVRYRLSYADVVECLAERGLIVERRLYLSLGSTLCPIVSDFIGLC
jgi:hypothetical protein